MMRGVIINIKSGWNVQPFLTVGETSNAGEDVTLTKLNYTMPGIPDIIDTSLRGISVKVD